MILLHSIIALDSIKCNKSNGDLYCLSQICLTEKSWCVVSSFRPLMGNDFKCSLMLVSLVFYAPIPVFISQIHSFIKSSTPRSHLFSFQSWELHKGKLMNRFLVSWFLILLWCFTLVWHAESHYFVVNQNKTEDMSAVLCSVSMENGDSHGNNSNKNFSRYYYQNVNQKLLYCYIIHAH